MSYLRFTYKDIEVELTPEVIIDIRKQLIPQVKQIPFIELVKTVEAAGLSPRNIVSFFGKVREEMKK